MLQTLKAAFGKSNRKQNAQTIYGALRQRLRNFTYCWAEFQRLAAELDYRNKTFINYLIEMLHDHIQQQFATGDEGPNQPDQVSQAVKGDGLTLTHMA